MRKRVAAKVIYRVQFAEPEPVYKVRTLHRAVDKLWANRPSRGRGRWHMAGLRRRKPQEGAVRPARGP